ATRNDKRLIAVVLGAPSSAARTIHAAQLLERGFNGDALTWLTPAASTVEELKPVEDTTPPNLHDEICGKHNKNKKPRAENEDEALADPAVQALMLSNLRGSKAKPGSVLGATVASMMPPVVVFTGPPKGPTKSPTQLAAPGDTSLQAAIDASKSGDSAATALATRKSTVATYSASTADDSVPLPRPRPKLARVKSANR